MYSLFKKEIKIFLGSLIGYLVVAVFLLVTGLFLWVFPGNYNILDSGYASLDSFFLLAPWLYLFLIPAITMRFFADERKSGTLELLLVRPVSDFRIVWAKYLAGMVLVAFSLFPTLLYFASVYWLGNPVGSIDVGATWGSFFGLFFLASIYVAIGVFASSLTENQIISFVLALVCSFVFYIGFEFVASTEIPYVLELVFRWLSINTHYLSASRGVIDLQDVVYFVGCTFLFLYITGLNIRKGRLVKAKDKMRVVAVLLGFAVLFFCSTMFLWRIDLTADKRYSLSSVSIEMVQQLDEPVSIEFFLDGELEPGLKRLQREVFEKVAILNAYAAQPIRIKVIDPYRVGNTKKRDEFIQELYTKGIRPTSFQHKTDQGIVSKLLFPGALIKMGGKEVPVNFLKYNQDFSHEYNFNYSIEEVEYELIRAFQKLTRKEKATVAFLEGHGEFNQYEVLDISEALSEDFEVKRINTETLGAYADNFDILVIAGPVNAFPEADKLIIDQYIMNGGKTLWLIDPVQVSVDSLSRGFRTFAFPRQLNIDDQLFKYGVRLNYELLQDVVCAQLMVNVAPVGSPPQFKPYPWYYSPLLTPNDYHPLSRNLNRVFAEYVSSLDTVGEGLAVNKSVILSTSPNARRVKSPSSVSLQNINNPPARELFNTPNIPVGVLLEGKFPSLFRNRMVEPLGFDSKKLLKESKPTKMIVIADAGLIANHVKLVGGKPRIQELGFDRVANRVWGNKEFLLSSVYYLNDEQGVMQLRNRNLKLRLLDRVRIREDKQYWQILNVLAPLLVLLFSGWLYNAIRRYRYRRE